MPSKKIAVSTTQELYSALAKCVGGETILLEGGNYGALNINPYSNAPCDFPSNVTIASADPKDPAVFSQVTVTGASNLAFDGVKFDYTYKAGDPIWTSPFTFLGVDGLTIKNSTFDGDVASGTGRTADDGYGTGKGLVVGGSSDVVIDGNELYGFHVGLNVYESSDTKVSGNEIHTVRMDGMTFAEMDGVLIEKNYIHDFRGSPTSNDHWDMIQFWTTGTDKPTSDVIIRDNVLDIGRGTLTQSIFMRNEVVDRGEASFNNMAYRNVLIENNTITNAHLWGISVGEANGVTIRQNTVVHADGRNVDGADPEVEIPLINVAATSTNVAVTGNVTSKVTGWAGQSGWTIGSNALVQDQNPSAPGFYADVFVASSLQPGNDGSHNFAPRKGGLIDKLGAGADTTQPSGPGPVDPGPVDPGPVDPGPVDPGPVDVEGPKILSMDGVGRFTAYDGGDPVALGSGKTATADGLQLGAAGTSATVARAHVLDVVGADDMTIAFTLDADRAGSSGELFRLHGSFVVSVSSAGELQVQIMRDGAPQVLLVTKGAGLNKAVNDESDIVISLDDGQLQVWVDGKLGGQTAVPGVVGGATGFDSHDLVFGNPWRQANFNGDISDLEISVGGGDHPGKHKAMVMAATVALEADKPAHHAAALDLVADDLTSADHVAGDGASNLLRGNGSPDTLNSGSGDDRLSGNSEADSFVFSSGRAPAMDLRSNVDKVLFDTELWSGGALDVGRILGVDTPSWGEVLSNFDNGNTLRVENPTVIGALTDDIVIA